MILVNCAFASPACKRMLLIQWRNTKEHLFYVSGLEFPSCEHPLFDLELVLISCRVWLPEFNICGKKAPKQFYHKNCCQRHFKINLYRKTAAGCLHLGFVMFFMCLHGFTCDLLWHSPQSQTFPPSAETDSIPQRRCKGQQVTDNKWTFQRNSVRRSFTNGIWVVLQHLAFSRSCIERLTCSVVAAVQECRGEGICHSKTLTLFSQMAPSLHVCDGWSSFMKDTVSSLDM